MGAEKTEAPFAKQALALTMRAYWAGILGRPQPKSAFRSHRNSTAALFAFLEGGASETNRCVTCSPIRNRATSSTAFC